MPDSRRICILTPSALGSNPRVVKEAEALHAAGYAVTVVSTRRLAHVDRCDDALLETARWKAIRLDYRTLGHAWLRHRARQITAGGLFRATGGGLFADRAVSPFSAPLLAAARRVAADLYIAHYPAALPAAAAAARRRGVRYAFDAEDFHPGDWPQRQEYDAMRRTLRRVEARHLPGCAYVTAAAPGIADAYRDAYGIPRPSVVLNVFSRAEAPPGATLAGTAQPGPSLYWFSQTIGPDRGLECAVAAIARAHTRPHLYLRGNPAPGYADRLRALAGAAGVLPQLHLLPPAAPREMAILAAQYDLGLAAETGHTPNRRIALTNKQFTYLLAGVPSVMSDIPAHHALAPELGAAARLYTAEDPDALAAAVDRLLENPAALAAARAAAFERARTRFNWEQESAVLRELVGSATGAAKTGGETPRAATAMRRRAAAAG